MDNSLQFGSTAFEFYINSYKQFTAHLNAYQKSGYQKTTKTYLWMYSSISIYNLPSECDPFKQLKQLLVWSLTIKSEYCKTIVTDLWITYSSFLCIIYKVKINGLSFTILSAI